MTSAEIQTFACARYQQMYLAYDLEFLVPGIRGTLLDKARERGASTAQAALYDGTRHRAAEAGLGSGSRKATLNKGLLARLEHEAEVALDACGREIFSLSHLRPAAVRRGAPPPRPPPGAGSPWTPSD